MKKNIAMRLASGLMLSCLLSTCVISGTFAKYTSTVSGTDTARIAKWSFELNDTSITNGFTFNLFNTINDTANDAKEEDVKADLIAPGTEGSFAIKLENLSEVDAVYSIDFTETLTGAADVPVNYSLDGTTWGSIDSLDKNQVDIAMETGAETITVYWQWAYEGDNAADTTLGLNGNVLVSVEAKVTVTQVD